jgi:C_GCAxxG_C_C family probable redox protein
MLYVKSKRTGGIHMTKADSAVDCFNSGFNCAQAVLTTYCEQFGLDKIQALKLAGSFGAGMGYTGGTCGAVSGAYLLIGLKHCKAHEDDNEAKEKNYEIVREFTRRFKEINGSVSCTQLLGYDLSTDDGLKAAREASPWESVCAKLVKDSVLIVEELLINAPR